MSESIISVRQLTTQFGESVIHHHLDMDIDRGEVVGIIGGSGSGKTTLLNTLLGLITPQAGLIKIFDVDVFHTSASARLAIQKRWGVVFQQNALFSSMTILDNVTFPLIEGTDLPRAVIESLAQLKIQLAGLSLSCSNQYPSELSGGMQKRAAIARAIVMDPELLIMDEPTAGLDPVTASQFDELILHLKKAMDLTIVIVTHDLDSLFRVTDRVAFLGDGHVIAFEPIEQLMKHTHPMVQSYFLGNRATRIRDSYE